MTARLFDIRARVGRWSVVVVRVDAVDSIDARQQVWRELRDDRVVFLECRMVANV